LAEWYYERGGERQGPVDEEHLKRLFANDEIAAETLVWTASLGDRWIRFDACAVAPPGAGLSRGATSVPFLSSELTLLLLGPRSAKYLAKWGKSFAKSGPEITQAVKIRSWNWAAFLFPTVWPFYRRLWSFGAVIMAIQIGVIFLPNELDSVSRAASLAMGVGAGMTANAAYLRLIHSRWLTLSRMPDQAEARRIAAAEGGVSIWGAIMAFLLLLAVFAVVLAPLLSAAVAG
jgi:hypothetical protein